MELLRDSFRSGDTILRGYPRSTLGQFADRTVHPTAVFPKTPKARVGHERSAPSLPSGTAPRKVLRAITFSVVPPEPFRSLGERCS